jgi:multidrug efflux pump subunit AcrA (membrane-fusion protein)
MGKVINLNKFRKQKAKLEREKQAETNRRLHGRTKAERQQELLQKQRLQDKVDGARLEPPTPPDEPRE